MRFAFAFVALALAACTVSPRTKRAQALYDARDRAHQVIAPKEAVAYAMALHRNVEEGDFGSNFAQLQSDAMAVLYVLERVVVDGAPRTPEVLAWRGIIYMDINRPSEARDELERSFALRPTLMAGERLIRIYSSLANREYVFALCQRTYAALALTDERVSLVGTCRGELAKLGDADVLAWLDPKSADWYKRELARRDAVALDAQEQRRLYKQRAAKVAQWLQRCSNQCHAAGVACQSGCASGDTRCFDKCGTTYDTCADRCESAAMKSLKQPATPTAAARRTGPSVRAGAKA